MLVTAATVLIVLAVLSLLITSSRGVSDDDYNSYSQNHNVWTYTFKKTPYEEEFEVHEEDPRRATDDSIDLVYLRYPNTNLPAVIVSPLFTHFLTSLPEIDYQLTIKPLLIRAINIPLMDCFSHRACDQIKLETSSIKTTLFVANIKKLLSALLSTLSPYPYLEILLWREKYIWYDMYWALDTTHDVTPVISYDKNFELTYRMCFRLIPLETVLAVHNTMKSILEDGANNETVAFLHKIANPWLKCVDDSYNHNLDALTKADHWIGGFLYNITAYRQASAMMEYMLNNIQNSYYGYITPHTIKENLNDTSAFLFSKPLMYSLYLSVFLEPYVDFLRQAQGDLDLIQKDSKLANLFLNITVFNESVPLTNEHDRIALNFISSHAFEGKSNDNDTTLGKFVHVALNNILNGYVLVSFAMFKTYSTINFGSSLRNLIETNVNLNVLPLKKEPESSTVLYKMTRLSKKVYSSESQNFWVSHCSKLPSPISQYSYREDPNDTNIDHLRHIAPNAKTTKKLLLIVHPAAIGHRPVRYDMHYLNNQYKIFAGNNTISSHSPLASSLAQLIKLYYRLRYIKPYEFYTREKNIIMFMKLAYNLQNLRHFTYFQAHMILYLQSIISILADPIFAFTQVIEEPATARIHFKTLQCALKFDEHDLTSLLINLRTISGGKKLLNRYSGESSIIYHNFMSLIERKSLDNPGLEIVYWRYQGKRCMEIFFAPPEKLYTLLKDPYFRLYAFIQDPIIFAKIVDDLLFQMKHTYSSNDRMHYL